MSLELELRIQRLALELLEHTSGNVGRALILVRRARRTRCAGRPSRARRRLREPLAIAETGKVQSQALDLPAPPPAAAREGLPATSRPSRIASSIGRPPPRSADDAGAAGRLEPVLFL